MPAGEAGSLYLRMLNFGNRDTSMKGGEPYMKKKRKSETDRNLFTLSKLLGALAALLKAMAELVRLFR